MWSSNFQMVQVHNASILHHEHYLSSCYQHNTIWSSVSHEGQRGTIRPWSSRRPRKAEKKRYSRSTGKLQYQNDWTVWSNSKKKVYKVDDMVSIKIDKVDKKSPFHPNLLLGKVLEIENNYVKVLKPFGRIKGFIAPSRLFTCTATK